MIESGPADDVRQVQLLDQLVDHPFHLVRFAVKLHDERQIERQIDQRGRAHDAIRPEAGDPLKNGGAHYPAIVMKQLHDLLLLMFAFAQIDARYRDRLSCHNQFPINRPNQTAATPNKALMTKRLNSP